MKHSTPDEIKFKRLMRQLNLPLYRAIGILEAIWITTQKSARRGDIGKYSNEDIAFEIGWQGDADELIGALVDIGWLDESTEHRLVVHDWPDHAPRYIHAWIKNTGTTFAVADGTVEPTVEKSTGPPTVEATAGATVPPLNQTEPNQTKPNLFGTVPLGGAVAEECNFQQENSHDIENGDEFIQEHYPHLLELKNEPVAPLEPGEFREAIYATLTKKRINSPEIVIWYRRQMSAIKPVLTGGNKYELVLVLAAGLTAANTATVTNPKGWFSSVLNKKRWDMVRRNINRAVELLDGPDVQKELSYSDDVQGEL